MKKLATLLLAAGMVLGSFAGAQAIDWKIKGAWQVEFGVYDGLALSKRTPGATRDNGKRIAGAGMGGDTFQSGQRFDTTIEAVASEALRGVVRLEMGDYQWGRSTVANQGTRQANGAMGQRGNSIGVREAYLDWFVPSTDLRVRMGIQSVANPSYTLGSMVLNQDVAGVVTSYKFNDNVSLTAFWVRPFNDNWTNNAGADATNPAGYMDNVDAFALVLPLSFDGFKVIPWGVIGAVGPNAVRVPGAQMMTGTRLTAVANGLMPAMWQSHNRRSNPALPVRKSGSQQYATMGWAGLTGEITAADPFRFAWDVNYGSINWADASYLNRSGWVANVVLEYKFDWGVPGLIGWYGSGDDSNPRNGSEQMPVIDINNEDFKASTFGFNGSPQKASPESVLGTAFYTGTWGIGARLRDVSFLEGLKHTLRVNLFGGTNDPVNAKYILGKKAVAGANRGGTIGRTDFNAGGAQGTSGAGVYMTTLDYGVEVNLDHSYKIYENLEMIIEMGYIHLWMDQSKGMWGGTNTTRGVSLTDAVKASVFFKYSF